MIFKYQHWFFSTSIAYNILSEHKISKRAASQIVVPSRYAANCPDNLGSMSVQDKNALLGDWEIHAVVQGETLENGEKDPARLGKTWQAFFDRYSFTDTYLENSELGTCYEECKEKDWTNDFWDNSYEELYEDYKKSVFKGDTSKPEPNYMCPQCIEKIPVERLQCQASRKSNADCAKNYDKTCECLKADDPLGRQYRGSKSTTQSGQTCQAWNVDYPNKVKVRPTETDTAHNYCRNYDNDDKGPWCYLANPEKGKRNYEYCDIESCLPPVTFAPPSKNQAEPSCGISGLDRSPLRQVQALPTFRMIDGTRTKKGELPWQVGLRTAHGTNFCGGSLLNQEWVLSAAHCVTDLRTNQVNRDASNTFAAIGYFYDYGTDMDITTVDRQLGAAFTPVDKIIVHPSWSATALLGDIALLRLQDRVNYPDEDMAGAGYNTLVRPICLPTPEYERAVLKIDTGRGRPTYCEISGWGDTQGTHKKGEKNMLLKGSIPSIPTNQCEARLNFGRDRKVTLLESHMCADHPDKSNRVDTCQGDSGGPFQCKYKPTKRYAQYGVTSFGYGCGESTPGVYSKVTFYLDWIEETIAANSKGVNYGVQKLDASHV